MRRALIAPLALALLACPRPRDEADDPYEPADGSSDGSTDERPPAWVPVIPATAVEAPEIAVIVYVYNGGEGSETSVPIARDILDWYFRRKADITSQFITPIEPSPTPSDPGQPTP